MKRPLPTELSDLDLHHFARTFRINIKILIEISISLIQPGQLKYSSLEWQSVRGLESLSCFQGSCET